jgi:hypothetical protein
VKIVALSKETRHADYLVCISCEMGADTAVMVSQLCHVRHARSCRYAFAQKVIRWKSMDPMLHRNVIDGNQDGSRKSRRDVTCS